MTNQKNVNTKKLMEKQKNVKLSIFVVKTLKKGFKKPRINAYNHFSMKFYERKEM